jgi:NAD(P)-dependent dehydrogenase (short-subunit alcohol dehydrogenase family)
MDRMVSTMMQFADRSVLVTGAAGNLGRAVAQAFHAQDARLVLVDRPGSNLREAFGPTLGDAAFVEADLRDAPALGAVLAPFGAIDVLCNVAGGFRMGEPVHELSDETWDFLFDLNCRTIVNTARYVVPGMIGRKAGKIINVGAAAAARGVPGMGAYCASKSAVARLTEAMSAELAPHGVNVNCVMPTIIDTPQNRADMPHSDRGGWVAPHVAAQTIMFLASSAAGAIHGACIPLGR